MKITCLMGTYGRYKLVCESLACFLQQTALSDANLLILNQHPQELHFDHPRVRVINEQLPGKGLRGIKLRMLELAEPSDYIHWWDDDDLYLPWHLEDCLDHIGQSVAWKPERSWTLTEQGYRLEGNYFEASTLFRASYVRSARADTHPNYADHPIFMQLTDAGLITTTDLGDLASYLYRWNTGVPHVSFHMDASLAEQGPVLSRLREGMVDPGSSSEMVIPDLWPHWQALLDGIQSQVSPRNFDELQARLSLACAASNLQPATT